MKLLIVIPHYNHQATVAAVAQRCAQFYPVAVFDDGSTPPAQADVPCIRFEKNQGKGSMIMHAARYAAEHGYTHILTLDADGQHDPGDIPTLVSAAEKMPQAIVIGVRKFDATTVPFSSRFGRAFGGFWVHLQTGCAIHDIQSGLRIYPVNVLNVLKVWSKRYAFEVEITVRALWAGFKVCEVPVAVSYPKQRISHFNKLTDNLRLTLLNTYLTIRSMLPVPHRQYTRQASIKKRGYIEVMIENLKKPGSAYQNARSAAWGMFCGSIALPGIRQVMLFMGAGWWNLNRILAIGFEKLCIGPIIPALCIEVGFFLRHGRFLTTFNLTTLGQQFLQRVWEWVVGSFFVAPLLAVFVFGSVWCICKLITRGLCANTAKHGAQ